MKKIILIFCIISLFCISFNNTLTYKNDVKDNFDKVNWENDIDLALNLALSTNKIILIEFMADWCPPCKKMEKETFSDEIVIKKLNKFILVRIDVDKQPDVAQELNGNAKKYGGIGIPNILFLDKDKNIVHRIIGFHNASQLITVMDSVLND